MLHAETSCYTQDTQSYFPFVSRLIKKDGEGKKKRGEKGSKKNAIRSFLKKEYALKKTRGRKAGNRTRKKLREKFMKLISKRKTRTKIGL